MGIKRRKTDRSYKGIELNEDNVQLIFQNSIAAPDTPKEECVGSILFSRVCGYSEEDEDILYFSKDMILYYKQDIAYLFGQLKTAHTASEESRLSIQEAFVDYTGKQWTSNNAILLELLYLGAAEGIGYISPFIKSMGTAIFVNSRVKPTLSPNDPNYPAWWEAHKAEWETPQSKGDASIAIERRKTDRSYKGIELNEDNVQLIFQNSIAAPGTPKEECVDGILFSPAGGFSIEDSDILYFNRDRILRNKRHIAYLLGQLKRTHFPAKDSHLSIQDAFIDYTGKPWTSNNPVLLELLYLGSALDYVAPFTKSSGSAIFVTDTLMPTLSPKDPNFPAWWEAHKTEWETAAE